MARRASPAPLTADRLHSAAIHLLRRLRREDAAAGIGPARLSALSVLVFGGPMSLKALAEAEQVQAPTMTKIAQALVTAGLARRAPVPGDRRGARLVATARGRRVLEAGRRRRVARLAADLAALPETERRALERAVGILEQLGGGTHRG